MGKQFNFREAHLCPDLLVTLDEVGLKRGQADIAAGSFREGMHEDGAYSVDGRFVILHQAHGIGEVGSLSTFHDEILGQAKSAGRALWCGVALFHGVEMETRYGNDRLEVDGDRRCGIGVCPVEKGNRMVSLTRVHLIGHKAVDQEFFSASKLCNRLIAVVR